MSDRVAIGFGVPNETDPHHWKVLIPAARAAEVQLIEDFGLSGGNGRPETIERCRLPRAQWSAVKDAAARMMNERLKEKQLPTHTWKPGENAVERLLGKELCVLFWGVEKASIEQIPNALRNWLALRPEERWWLFTMAASSTGTADHTDMGWRKAIRVALTEATPDAEPAPRRKVGALGSKTSDEGPQIDLFMKGLGNEPG